MKTLLLATACAFALAGCGQAAPPAQAQEMTDSQLTGVAAMILYADMCPKGEADIHPSYLLMGRGIASVKKAEVNAKLAEFRKQLTPSGIPIELGTAMWCSLMKPTMLEIKADALANQRAQR